MHPSSRYSLRPGFYSLNKTSLCLVPYIHMYLTFRFVFHFSLLDKTVVVDGEHQISGARDRYVLIFTIIEYKGMLSF